MFTYIMDKSCKALSVLLGRLWEGKNYFCTSSDACSLIVFLVSVFLVSVFLVS